ncbi:MAG: DUF116 domain-containing protein [Candidatus Doudnabacteria bacterium]
MVGAGIMNRSFRDAYVATKRKAVILPACMRYHPKPTCKARFNGLSCECTGCTPQCRVNQVRRWAKSSARRVPSAPHVLGILGRCR